MAGAECIFALIFCPETVPNDFGVYLQKALISRFPSVCVLTCSCVLQTLPLTRALWLSMEMGPTNKPPKRLRIEDVSVSISSSELLTPWAFPRFWKLNDMLEKALSSKSMSSVPLPNLTDKTVAASTKRIDEIDMKFLLTLFRDSEKVKAFLEAKNALPHGKLFESVVRGIKG